MIQISGDDVVVIHVKSHSPATLLALNTVQNQIIDKLMTAEINVRAEQLAKDIATKLQNGADPVQIASQYHLAWTQAGFIGRRANKINSAITEAAFAMPRPAPSKLSYATSKMPDGFAIVGLKAARNGVTTNHDQYQVFAEQVQNTQGLMEYELYKQSMMEHAKIVLDS